MSDRQIILFEPTRPTSIQEPHEQPFPEPDLLHPRIEDLGDLRGPTSTATRFLLIDPSWNALDLRTAYSHLLRTGDHEHEHETEHPELLLHNVAQPSLLDFVQAVEIGFKHSESRSRGEGSSLAEAIEGAGCSRWLTEGDVERAVDWVVARGREMDLDVGYQVPDGYQGVVLNRRQLGGRDRAGGLGRAESSQSPVRPGGGAVDDNGKNDDEHRLHHDLASLDMTGSTADQAIALSDSEDDADLDLDHHNHKHNHTSPRKRRARSSSSSNDTDEPVVTSSPTKKQRVREDSVAYVPSRTPSRSPSLPTTPTPAPAGSRQQDRSASPARRTRWTASQQFAMVSLLYTTGYEGADWESIARLVNAANPLGPSKTKSRVKSAMRETHWTNFLRNNAEGRFPPEQLVMVMPDMSGPAPSGKPAWTAGQKEIVWAETFTHGERHVNWKDVAEAVNDAAAGQESLYRKPLDCEKTWRDTLRRHFGLQGRRR